MPIKTSHFVLATVVAVIAFASLLVYLRDDGALTAPGGAVSVVSAPEPPRGGLAAGPTPAGDATPDAPSIAPMLAEAPAPLRDLHTQVSSNVELDTRYAANVRDAFSRSSVFTGLSIICARDKCEVHGMTTVDEARTRMALRDDAFLNELSDLGLTSGMDMVSQRGASSEFVVYLDRTPPVK